MRGIVPERQLHIPEGSSPREHFHEGQVIKLALQSHLLPHPLPVESNGGCVMVRWHVLQVIKCWVLKVKEKGTAVLTLREKPISASAGSARQDQVA